MLEGQRWVMCKKDRDEWVEKFDKAIFLPMPILLNDGSNYVCYGGRHRIGWCEYRKIHLNAWIGDINGTYRTERLLSKDQGETSKTFL